MRWLRWQPRNLRLPSHPSCWSVLVFNSLAASIRNQFFANSPTTLWCEPLEPFLSIFSQAPQRFGRTIVTDTRALSSFVTICPQQSPFWGKNFLSAHLEGGRGRGEGGKISDTCVTAPSEDYRHRGRKDGKRGSAL